MSSVNKVIILGNVGRDPEFTTTQNGGRFCRLTVATSERWKDKQTGERKETTEWHRVVVFNENIADVIERYVTKGSKVYLEGQLQTRKWQDQSGADRYSTEIVVSNFRGELVLCGERGEGGGSAPQGETYTSGGRRQAAKPDIDDEIPF